MPLGILAKASFDGLAAVPYSYTILRTLPWIALVYLLKMYFGGARNRSERMMHSKVVMMTGGTSGIGAAVARNLAQRGAQVIILTRYPASDPFIADYIEDLRSQTSNELIYAEHVDLSSLHSIRVFATKWVDNAPPRRLDAVILCANTITPQASEEVQRTLDGVELNWGVNFLANFHLLSILSPALRAQPPDRDVRVIMGTCSGYIGAKVADDGRSPERNVGAYGASKLALMQFAQSLQKHLDAYARPDKQPNNTRVILVDPGWTRTPGMRRWLTAGSLWGLLVYLMTWPIWWLVLKSPEQGAQSFLHASMEAELGRGPGGKLIKECREVDYARKDIKDEELAKKLWESSEKQIEALEKEGAVRRALAKKEMEKAKPEAVDGTANDTRGAQPRKPGSRRSRKEN